jgi:hypothetical protein
LYLVSFCGMYQAREEVGRCHALAARYEEWEKFKSNSNVQVGACCIP